MLNLPGKTPNVAYRMYKLLANMLRKKATADKTPPVKQTIFGPNLLTSILDRGAENKLNKSLNKMPIVKINK